MEKPTAIALPDSLKPVFCAQASCGAGAGAIIRVGIEVAFGAEVAT